MQLKQQWACEKHVGEHGELGYCFVNACGEHLGLNHRKLKLWAAAIVSQLLDRHLPLLTVA